MGGFPPQILLYQQQPVIGLCQWPVTMNLAFENVTIICLVFIHSSEVNSCKVVHFIIMMNGDLLSFEPACVVANLFSYCGIAVFVTS